jgi:predicted ArsR family transcriptional regulator
MAALAQAIGHPMRRRIITALNSPDREWSANGLAEEWGEPVGNVAYHCRELKDLGWVEVRRTAQKRGATEHFYGPTARTMAWGEEWKQVPDAAKRHLAAFALRLGVESVGATIDAGVFNSRDDSVLAQDTAMVDEQGAKEAMAIVKHAVEALMKVEERATARLAEQEEDGFAISWFMSGFPGAIRKP